MTAAAQDVMAEQDSQADDVDAATGDDEATRADSPPRDAVPRAVSVSLDITERLSDSQSDATPTQPFDADVDNFAERRRELDLVNRRRDTPRYRSLVLEWMRRWFRRPARPAIQPLPIVDPGTVSITFAGHATALIRYADLSIVCDPMLGRWSGAAKRAIAPGLSPADLHDVDLILISNAHPDHLHRATLAKLPRSATIVVPQRTARHVSALGFARVVELGIGQSLQHRGVDVATAATRSVGPSNCGSASYVVRGNGPSAYYCGDSGYFSGFAEVGRRYRPEIALLPIAGYRPLSFRARHMSPADALAAFEDLQSRILIPIRCGTFALSYELIEDPLHWLRQLVRERGLGDYIVALEPGASQVFALPSG